MQLSGAAMLEVAQLRSFKVSGSKATVQDQTNVLTPDNFDRPIPTRISSGEIEMDGVLDPANGQILQLGAAHGSLATVPCQVILSDGTQYNFFGFVSEYVPWDVKFDKAIAFSAKVRVSGALSGPAGNA
jgi:hypothetical protein